VSLRWCCGVAICASRAGCSRAALDHVAVTATLSVERSTPSLSATLKRQSRQVCGCCGRVVSGGAECWRWPCWSRRQVVAGRWRARGRIGGGSGQASVAEGGVVAYDLREVRDPAPWQRSTRSRSRQRCRSKRSTPSLCDAEAAVAVKLRACGGVCPAEQECCAACWSRRSGCCGVGGAHAVE